MAENSSSTKWIAIGCGALALVGMCCLASAGGWMWYAQKQEADAQRFLEERARDFEDDNFVFEEMEAPPPPPLAIDPRPSSDRRPRRITATITRADGASGLSVGQQCRFDVEVRDRSEAPGGYWCRALVNCSGVALFGEDRPDGTGNGYFMCEAIQQPHGVAGEDRETSLNGSDPFFQIDTRQGTFTVIDDASSTLRPGAFRVDAAITSVD